MTTLTGALPQVPPAVRRQVVTFVGIGGVCTVAYLVIYLGLRAVVSANVANITAQLITTIASTAANRRFTMGVTDPTTAVRHHLQMVALFLLGLGINALALDLLAQVAPDAGSVIELAVLMLSGLLVTAVRVAVMSSWQRTHSALAGHERQGDIGQSDTELSRSATQRYSVVA